MSNLILTAISNDRPGIVSEISSAIIKHDGNIEDSRMIRLGSDFVITMLISIDPEKMKILDISLKSLNEYSITTKCTELYNSNINTYQVDLTGADNEGIMNVLSKYLADKTINILEMDTYISTAPMSGTQLFNLFAKISIPGNIKHQEIQTDLKKISYKLGVDIDLKKI